MRTVAALESDVCASSKASFGQVEFPHLSSEHNEGMSFLWLLEEVGPFYRARDTEPAGALVLMT